MHRIHILVDFENVQPTAKEFNLIRQSQYRVKIFHGPHQNKFDADMVQALQPLGLQVEYVQTGRRGKNALDFQIAFRLGRLVEEHEKDRMATRATARFLVVSKDGGFDDLLGHIVSLGHAAARVPDITTAIEIGAIPVSQIASSGLAGVEALQSPKPVKIPKSNSIGAAKNKAAATIRQKLIDNLREHPKNRPSSRQALEHHVATLLGGKTAAKTAEMLVAALEHDGVVTISDKAINYAIPKNAK